MGAGRKRSKDNLQDPRHITREPLSRRHPVHVMLRTRHGVPRLRQRRVYEVVRRVLAYYLNGAEFRIVHISIQNNHLHLIAEASNEDRLRNGMAGFAIRTARAINRVLGRRGKLFKFRYKAKQIRTREYARNVIAYVLNNWRRHNEDLYDRGGYRQVFDTYSSAYSFTGWIENPRHKPRSFEPLPVSRPRTALLASDWLWYGLIDPYEVKR